MSQAASRFGQDGPSRITVAAPYLLEASETMPLEPNYQAVVPFISGVVSGSGAVILPAGATGLAGSTTTNDWDAYPGRLDLHWWQGDDVVVALHITDDDEPDLDLSDAAGCTWRGMVRRSRNKIGEYLYDFSVTSEFVPAVEETEEAPAVPSYTLVRCYLPRSANRFPGVYHWDLQVERTGVDYSDFPEPPNWDPQRWGEWPPETLTRTFVYGLVYVVAEITTPIGGSPVDTPIQLRWPNGRVP